MPNKFTEHYHLSPWEKTDQVLMEDFNADNLAIDAALKAEEAARTAAVDALSKTMTSQATELTKRGNCKIETQSYTGNGRSGDGVSVSITFSARSVVFFILGNERLFFASGTASKGTLMGVISGGFASGFNSCSVPLEWSGSRVTFPVKSENSTMNSPSTSYQAFAFIQAGS